MALGQQVSIEEVLKTFLQMPSVLDKTLSYMRSLSNNLNCVSNIIQGTLYKNISMKYSEKVVLPIGVYFDDWEANNPLGAHAGTHKIGSVYFSAQRNWYCRQMCF